VKQLNLSKLSDAASLKVRGCQRSQNSQIQLEQVYVTKNHQIKKKNIVISESFKESIKRLHA